MLNGVENSPMAVRICASELYHSTSKTQGIGSFLPVTILDTELDTLKRSFSHLLPAGMSPVGLGRSVTWFSPGHQVVGRGERGGALPLCSQAACCQELGPTGKGPLGFFFFPVFSAG